jgi:xanthine dehydrogenase YagR molybdenum-binding subunit
MAEATYRWPSRERAALIGKQHDRIDGMVKSTGTAKFTYDVNLKDQLIVQALGSPHAHCRVKSVDTRAAEKVQGVVHVHVRLAPQVNDDGTRSEPEIEYQGELIAAVAAETEAAAAEGVAKLKVEYGLLDVFVQDEDLQAAEEAGRTDRAGGRIDLVNEPGPDEDEEQFEEKEIERLLEESKYTVEGYYGADVITHCCLETHGSTVQWKDDKLQIYLSTQNVSGCDDQVANSLGITADEVDVICEYIGGGFGSKFAPDYWTVMAAEISRATGRPVKFMLSRDQDQKIAGNRPSGFVKVRLGADEKGVVQVWDSQQWGTSGPGRGGVSVGVIPYVFAPPNRRRNATSISTNQGEARAWRAPNHPQACVMTQTAYDDLAAKMGADSYDIFLRNLQHIASQQPAEIQATVYADQMKIAADLMDWKAQWHPHGKGPKQGSIVEGLGMAIHTWGGQANRSACQLRIHPSGAVESYCGTQDLGTGTRTVCALVLAETLGLPVEAVKVNIGHSTYPFSGASGGSTTVGAVSESHRRAAQDALVQLNEKVAAKLGVDAGSLEAVGGRIQVAGDPSKGLGWKEACGLLGIQPLEVTSSHGGGPSTLSGEGVGGVQMAHVAVDADTGVIKMKKMVAVQDMGLIINRKTAESQMHGALIMGITYSLFEQQITDPRTGAFLNAGLADYKLARLGDIGEIVLHLYETEDQRRRGVIGVGEPPVISPGAAISNAVCNALGVRVPVLPLTPKRVLQAIQKARVS